MAMPDSSKVLEDLYIGTEEYISPEGLSSGPAAAPCFENDLWSLGVMIWQIFSAKNATPFEGVNQEETFSKIRSCELGLSDADFGYSNSVDTVPAEVKDLISKLLVKIPEHRLGSKDISELKQHPFFQGIDFDSLFCG